MRAWKLTPGTNFSVGSRAAIERMEAVEHADAGGERTDRMLRGDAAVVRERRERAAASSRSRAAVQAALDKIALPKAAAPIAAETLRKEREAVAARGGIVPKTAAKVATDEHTWEDFVRGWFGTRKKAILQSLFA